MRGTKIIGGGGLPSGVTSDGQTPGGLTVAGQVAAEALQGLALGDTVSPAVLAESLSASNDALVAYAQNAPALAVSATHAAGGGICGRFVANGTNAIALNAVATGSGGTAISANGKVLIVAGLGVWNHAAPASQPVLATGASKTVDDVITLLQSYGLCKQS